MRPWAAAAKGERTRGGFGLATRKSEAAGQRKGIREKEKASIGPSIPKVTLLVVQFRIVGLF